jgi:hypothetical protein
MTWFTPTRKVSVGLVMLTVSLLRLDERLREDRAYIGRIA